MQRTIALGLSLSALLVGCAADPISTSIAIDDQWEDLVCSCPTLAGVASEAICRAEFAEFELTDTEEACIRRVYAAHQAELDLILNCENDASQDYNDCIRPLLVGCPTTADLTPCDNALDDALAACPSASVQTSTELEACFP